MEMSFRWYGTGHDSITLQQIRQIPGMKGVITTLYATEPGEAWTREAVHALNEEVKASGLKICGIESVNVHDDIKAGLPTSDMYIENYIKSLTALGEEGIDMVCYNFMPVFDWTRTESGQSPARTAPPCWPTTQADSGPPEPRGICSASISRRSTNGFVHARLGAGAHGARQGTCSRCMRAWTNEALFANLKYFLEAHHARLRQIRHQHGHPSRRSGVERVLRPAPHHHQRGEHPCAC